MMHDDNSGLSGSGHGSGPSSSYRVRRPSSSIISSTTPMFQAPQNVPLQPPPSPHQFQHHPSRQQRYSNNYGHGEVDDDGPHQGRGIAASISSGNQRSQSPLGSPDSSWGPAPSPAPHSYRAPLTPGGMCVVSSSTSDDIPPSPFSPEDLGANNSIPHPPSPLVSDSLHTHNHNRRPVLSSSSSIVVTHGSDNAVSASTSRRANISGSSSLNLSLGGGGSHQMSHRSDAYSSSSSNRNERMSHPVDFLQQVSNNYHAHNHQSTSTASSSSSSSSRSTSSSFGSMTPLRNKIKKASSFERFSQAQAAIMSNAEGNKAPSSSSFISQSQSNNNHNDIANNSSDHQHPLSISSASIPPNSVNTITNTSFIRTNPANPVSNNSSSSNNTGHLPRTTTSSSSWVSSPSPPPPSTAATITTTPNPSSLAYSTARTSSLPQTLRSLISDVPGEKFHSKIPSKKLAAKLASAYEQERLNEELYAALGATAASEALSALSSIMSPKRPGVLSQHQQPPVTVITNTSGLNSQHDSGLLNSHSSLGQGSSSGGSSTLAQILNQSASTSASAVHDSNSIMNERSLNQDVNNMNVNNSHLIGDMSDESPLNLTESGNNTNQVNSNSNLPQRNPVISMRVTPVLSKKIPLTPKQKLLHRLQVQTAGELLTSLSPPPIQTTSQSSTLSQQLQHQSSSSSSMSMQQQQPVVVPLHKSIGNDNTGHIVSAMSNNSGVPSSPPPHSSSSQPTIDQYSYESLMRSRDDFVVQDSLNKTVGGEDPNAVSNMLSAYDPADAYSYYSYQNIFLGDEIFTGNNSNATSATNKQLLSMPTGGSLQDTMEQSQPPLDFVLGLNGTDEHDGVDRERDDDLQLNSIDPNEALTNAIKSHQQQQADSTLRNLLMMEPVVRNSHGAATTTATTADDATWLALAAEYQNRINSDALSIARSAGNAIRNGSSLVVSGGNIIPSNVSSMSSSSIMGQGNSVNNSWVNDWPPRSSSWQAHHTSLPLGGGGSLGNSMGGGGSGMQEQDEVMNMSMMDHMNKGSVTLSNHMKRLQIQMQAGNNSDPHIIDDMDLTPSLPLLPQMSVNMPIDLQQPMPLLASHNSAKEMLPMDLQQHPHHHRMQMHMDDEPVNLISVNIDQEQSHYHHHHPGNTSPLDQSRHSHHEQQHLEQQHQLNKALQFQPQNSSYTLQIHSHHSPPELHQHQHPSELSLGNIDERRIIRAKKSKDFMLANISPPPNDEDSYQQIQPTHVNIIMDKPVQPKSIASLPSPFRLARTAENEIAVFSNLQIIRKNTRLGPVEGPLRKATGDIANVNASYPSIVMTDDNDTVWMLDRGDDDFCNWMKFVRLAHSLKSQNAVIVESEGYVYFMTSKDIPPEAELQVGYGYDYAQKYGLPVLLPIPSSELDEDSRDGDGRDQNGGALMCSDKSQSQSPTAFSIVECDNLEDQCVRNVCNPKESDNSGGEDSRMMLPEPEPEPVPDTVYSCIYCDKEYALPSDLQAHMEIHEENMALPPKPRKKRKIVDSEIVKSHPVPVATTSNTSSHSDQSQKQAVNADSSTITVEENSNTSLGHSHVQQQNSSAADLGKQQDNSVTTGVGQVTAAPKVKCTMCYKAFLTKERLEKHMIVHSDEDTKPLKCNFCSKRFLTNSALAGHTKTHAEEGKFFECPMCKFSTTQLLQLKEHVQNHKSRDTGMFYCPKCPKKFSAYSMIRKHIRAFHGPRQYICDKCTMSFPTTDKLRLHQLKHSDHREFLCAECGKQFKRKDKLREHTKRIHETKKRTTIEINIPKDKNSKKILPKYTTDEYQRFPFKCPDCMVGFKRRGMLVNHLAKRHPEKKLKSIPELNQPILRLARNYPCLYCERVYKSSSKRKAHILKGHPGRPVPPQLRGTGVNAAIVGNASIFQLNDVVRKSTIGTIVQTVTEDGDPRSGIMNVSCNSASEHNLVSTTSTSQSLRKDANVVGKIVASPHACQWCYREYATRAKLLQHQRKNHINLMPAEIQTPRTQKNNVSKVKGKPPTTAAATTSTKAHSNKKLTQQKAESTLIIPDSTSPAPTTVSTIQTLANITTEGFGESNVIGYLLTTTSVNPEDLGNLIPSELVMLGPVQTLSSTSTGTTGGTTATAKVLTATTAQQPQSLNINPNQNITIIATKSSSSNSSSNNS